MPKGKVSKVVHLSLQSSDSADASPASKGYGYLTEADGEASRVYFDAKAVDGYSFDDLQVGQEVEYDPDPKLPTAKKIRLIGTILAPPTPQVDLP